VSATGKGVGVRVGVDEGRGVLTNTVGVGEAVAVGVRVGGDIATDVACVSFAT